MSERWREVLRSVPDTTASAVCYIGWHYPVVGASLSCRSCTGDPGAFSFVTPQMLRRPPPPDLPLPQGSRGPQSSGRSCRFMSTRRLHVSGQGTPFYVLLIFQMLVTFYFVVLLMDAWPLPPRHATGPAHLVATLRTRHLSAQHPHPPPHVCAFWSPSLILNFFVHFTVKQRFWLRIWPSDIKTHRYLTIFKPDKVKKEKVYFYLEISNETFQRRHGLRIEKKEKRNSFVSSCIVNVDDFICIILKKLPYQF